MVTIDTIKTIQPTIVKQIQSLYSRERIVHAYLFEGDKGTGKSQVTQFFIQLLLCEQVVNNEPCGQCRQCRLVHSGNHTNIHHIYPDGATIKIEQVRNLMKEMKMVGIEEGHKFYIIHHADKMNVAAANMLLKFLEEPVGKVTAILLTEQYQAILPTILSRCQHFKFSAIPREVIIEQLIAQEITKSMASTVSLLTNDLHEAIRLSTDEQFVQMRKTVLHLISTIQQNVQEALLYIQEAWIPVYKEREDFERALDLLLFAYRDIVALKADIVGTAVAFPDKQQEFENIALNSTYERLSKQMQAILKARDQLHRNMNRSLLMEQLMLNLQEGYAFV